MAASFFFDGNRRVRADRGRRWVRSPADALLAEVIRFGFAFSESPGRLSRRDRDLGLVSRAGVVEKNHDFVVIIVASGITFIDGDDLCI